MQVFGIRECEDLFNNDFSGGDGCFSKRVVVVKQRNYHIAYWGYFIAKFITGKKQKTIFI